MDEERFKKVESQIGDIHTALLGSLDKPGGLMARVDRLEQHNKYIAGLTAPGVVLGVAWIRGKLGI